MKASGSDNRSPFWRAQPKSTGAQVTLLQRQQTVASAPFQTLCGHFLSQRLKRTVVGGKEEEEEDEGKKRSPLRHTHNTNLMYVDENGRRGRGRETGLRHNFKALIELPLQLLRLIVAVVCLSVA